MAHQLATTLLIPPAAFEEHGPANGRAMAYLAHEYLGNVFGSIYDVSTILILAFAGASAMAGLLNLIPRYLPRYGMAPEWARASRPLVLVFMAVAFAVTYLFHADVDAQGGAYATGVLVLITSRGDCGDHLSGIAIFAGHFYSCRWCLFTPLSLISPSGLRESRSILLYRRNGRYVSISRALRSTELRISGIHLDEKAHELLGDDDDRIIRIIARKPKIECEEELDLVDRQIRSVHSLNPGECLYFFEVERADASDFEKSLLVTGERVGKHRILRAKSPVVANAFAGTFDRPGTYHRQRSACLFQLGRGPPYREPLRIPVFWRRRRRTSHP